MQYTRNGKTYAIEPGDNDELNDAFQLVADQLGVPVNSVAYLIEYGFKQSLQDAAAQPASAANTEATDKKLSPDETSQLVANAIDGAMSKRLDAIKSGNVAMRGGGGRVSDPVERTRRDYIDEKLAANAAQHGQTKTFNKLKADKLNALRAAYYNKFRADVDAEVKRRMESTSKVDADNLIDSLLKD